MRIVDVVQTAVRRLGYGIIRRPHSISHPIDLLDVLIRNELASDPMFFFVQIGANDGIRVDPLRPSVLRHRLRGLFIEPLPDLFERLVDNYAGHMGLLFENCAISDHDGTQRMYRTRADAPLSEEVQALTSFNRTNL